jgi:ABC-type sugar transport system permease subunit
VQAAVVRKQTDVVVYGLYQTEFQKLHLKFGQAEAVALDKLAVTVVRLV